MEAGLGGLGRFFGGRPSKDTSSFTWEFPCLDHEYKSLADLLPGNGSSPQQQHIELVLLAGNAGEKTRKLYQAKVDAINRLEPSMQALSDDQLRDKTKELQQRIAGGASLDDVLAEAFAVSVRMSCYVPVS